MTRKIGKTATLLVTAMLVLSPLRVSWAQQTELNPHAAHQGLVVTTQLEQFTKTESCCADDGCMLESCESCNLINPVLFVGDSDLMLPGLPAYNLSLAVGFSKPLTKPLLHPPKV